MSSHTQREFGRNVTNAIGSKSVSAKTPPLPLLRQRQQRTQSAGEAAGDASRWSSYRRCAPEGGDACNDDGQGGVSCKRRRTENVPQERMQTPVEREVLRPHPRRSSDSPNDSPDSIERCVDEDVVPPQDSSISCGELLSAVADADAAMMTELRCEHRLGSVSPPPPPVVPMLFSFPDAL